MSDEARVEAWRQETNPALTRVPIGDTISPREPKKCINEGEDLAFFLTSSAYVDILKWTRQLNRAMFPVKESNGTGRAWPTGTVHIIQSPQVVRIKVLVQTLATMLKDTPAETGPRRFGNAAFKTWYKKLEARTPDLLQQSIPDNVWDHVDEKDVDGLKQELGSYLLGSFGSPERLDYGTGHELSFMAFLGGIWKLNGFAPSTGGSEERGIVVGIIEPYLELVRNLIKTYSLEPAGSHGVWGLDDHSFVPYIFGSAQLSPVVALGATPPNEGSLQESPKPAVVAQEQAVRILAPQNLYFSAIAFIFDVKKGPFWEHSPTLFDISGVEKGWAKINQGLLKMYNAEVLSKFPVVQHLRFGSLFRWERDPSAIVIQASVHARNQPVSMPPSSHPQPSPQSAGTRAPWGAGSAGSVTPMGPSGAMAAPWARKQDMSVPTSSGLPSTGTRFPIRQGSSSSQGGAIPPSTRYPSQPNPRNA